MADTPADSPPGRPPRRTVRDWGVDTLLFLVAAFFGLIAGET
ncbi:sensor histidine kinase, partial [Streptomyces sp. ms191]